MKNLLSSHSKKFWIILSIILILIIISISIPIYFLTKSNNSDYSNNYQSSNNITTTNTLNNDTNLPDCGSTKELLKNSPIAVKNLSTIIPMGNFAPPGHIGPTGHMYYNYLNSGAKTNPIPAKTEIVSPADMTITTITLFDNASAVHPFNSYRIDFQVCKQVMGYFIHVVNLSDKLNALVKEPWDNVQTSKVGGTVDEHTYKKVLNLKVNAGDLIGSSGGSELSPFGLDFGLIDTRTPLPVEANPARWKDDSHYVCSLDYYPADLSKTLYAHLGDYSYNFLPADAAEPKCGTVYHDIPGTAQGVWFTKVVPHEMLGDPAEEITLGHSNFNEKNEVFSLGNRLKSIGINTDMTFIFSPNLSGKVNLDFSKVKPDGNIYCYELSDPSSTTAPKILILLNLLDENTLHLGKLTGSKCGVGPWTNNNYVEYVR